MNRLLKNVDGQHVYFRLLTTGLLPNPGVAPDANVSLNGGAFSIGGRSVVDLGQGLYCYPPTAAETNADEVAYYFGSGAGSYPPELVALRTESAGAGGDVTLAASQPHYAPAKAGDAMALLADQDVRNILGSVAGDIAGDVLGAVQLPATLPASLWNSLLDLVDGVQTNLTVREALRELVAALVNVQTSIALSIHAGPSSSHLSPRFGKMARAVVGQAAANLLRAVEFNAANPELGLLSPQLVIACQQMATALDAVRTASA